MIPLYKPYMPEDLSDLVSILHSGCLSYGEWGRLFEDKLSLFLGVDYLLTSNSYASAIQIALTVLGLHEGDEVICSPMSCLASNMPLLTFGLKVVWADIDPATGTLSPDSVKEKITGRTKLIFHNHFCGYVGYADEIDSIGKEYGIPVLDDCVEAFGSKYKGNYAGNTGSDISVYSFQTVRLPNTIDGGAVVFKDKELYDKALLMRDFGIRRPLFRDDLGEISSQCDISMKGYGATMSEVNSYIGCCQMNDMPALLERQKRNAHCWDAYFQSAGYRVLAREESEPNYWVYGLLSADKRADLERFREMGYHASGVHLPNNRYSVFGGRTSWLPGVDEFHSRFLALPCGWWFKRDQFTTNPDLHD